jgi:hypothetical protein
MKVFQAEDVTARAQSITSQENMVLSEMLQSRHGRQHYGVDI